MKNFIIIIAVSLGLFANSALAQPKRKNIISKETPSLELRLDKKEDSNIRYLPIWIVEDAFKHKIRKYIWVPSEDGNILVLEASSSAILRLAWNQDTYSHEAKTKTN